ncbi:MAG: hydrogenase 4 subunit B [Acidiferrobacter sp.]
MGVLAVVGGWIAIGLLSLVRSHSIRVVRLLFSLGALAGLALGILGWQALSLAPVDLILPLGLPGFPIHLRLDPLSAFFLLLLGFAAAGVSLFSAGYFHEEPGRTPGLLSLQYHTFLASMALVLLANDAYGFMVFWETMALSSYFLVTTEHHVASTRRAGFLYLLLTHIGALSILLCFGILQGGGWQFTFTAMRATPISPVWASIAFGLAVLGFGAKAGLVPVHVWLPEAHPAAPSPVSALMSGAMLKMAAYGLLLVSLVLLPHVLWWWGAMLIALGLFTALFGAVFAAVQTDIKRLLAYSSVENMGIVFAGIGLTLLFHSFHMPVLAALALTATLYQCLNHTFFKSLLFLVAGSVLHATGERNLGKFGGLIHKMPWVAALGLIGALAAAGLPPLNGFVSEWLLLQSFLFTPRIPQSFANMLVPTGAAMLALVAALAGYVMVKLYGVIFLGQMRQPQLADAHDCNRLERFGLLWFAIGCVLLGLLPSVVVRALAPVNRFALANVHGVHATSLWLLSPISPHRASYDPIILLLGIVSVIALTRAFVVLRRPYRLRHAPVWNCGNPPPGPRMQDTAEGLGQPIRHIFAPFFRIARHLPTPFDAVPRYEITVEDRSWYILYAPIIRIVRWAEHNVGRLQNRRISTYLLYSFLTLIVLLVIFL